MMRKTRFNKLTTYHIGLANQRNRVTFFRPEKEEPENKNYIYYPDDKRTVNKSARSSSPSLRGKEEC